MDIIGIICEYNPLHNGHIYHINKIKELYPHSLLILVLNGYFLERGEKSILTKEDKTKLALFYGIDIVVELPTLFGTQAADIFASKAIEILSYFHVQKLIFGSELNDIESLKKIVDQLEKAEAQNQIKVFLVQGLNYPTALSKAIQMHKDFNNPNDLLAISYIKAIQKGNYAIEPISIQRTSHYHDIKSTDKIVSASNIRNKIKKQEDIRKYLPQNVIPYIKKPQEDVFFKLLKLKILTTPHLEDYLTVDEGIENKLIESMKQSKDFDTFIKLVKTKRYTYNKIHRMCIHILLGILKKENTLKLPYIRILGFNKKGQEYLKTLKKELKEITKIDKNSTVYKTEMKASILYDLIYNTNTFFYEKQNKPIKKP